MANERLTEVDSLFLRINEELREIQPMPLDELVPFSQNFVKGQVVHWDATKSWTHPKENSPLLRFHHGLIGETTKESEAAAKILANDLNSFKPNLDLIKSERFEQFWRKLNFASDLWISVWAKRYYKEKVGWQLQRYGQIAQRQLENLSRTLVNMKVDDLSAFYRLSEFMWQYSRYGTFDSNQLKSSDPHVEEALKKSLEFGQKLASTLIIAGSRFDHDWDWNQVAQTIDAMDWIESPRVQFESVGMLMLNLNHSKHLQTDTLRLINTADFRFNTRGLAKLLAYKPQEKLIETLTQISPTWNDYFNTVASEELPIPKKHTPYPLIELYAAAQKAMPPDVFKGQLGNLLEVVQNDKDLTNNFVTLIVVLNKTGLLPNDDTNQMVAELASLPSNFKEVLLGQSPGKVWLTTQRRLRVTDNKTNLTSAFLLYTSTASEIVETDDHQVQTIEQPQEPKIPENRLETDLKLAYDFVGDIAIANDDDAVAYLAKLNESTIFYEEDLIERFDNLQSKFKQPDQDKTYIYHGPLNPQDVTLREARRLGFETIVVSGNVVTFILNKDILYSLQEERKIPVSITGILGEDGLLALDAYEEPPLNNVAIALNNIALELASRRLQAPKPEQLAELKKMAKEPIGEWNRATRGSLPRLSADLNTDQEVLIAVRIGDQTLFTSQA